MVIKLQMCQNWKQEMQIHTTSKSTVILRMWNCPITFVVVDLNFLLIMLTWGKYDIVPIYNLNIPYLTRFKLALKLII